MRQGRPWRRLDLWMKTVLEGYREAVSLRFEAELRPTAADRVLTIGMHPSALPSVNFFEHRYPWKRRLTALCIDDMAPVAASFPEVRFVYYDGGRFPFRDGCFDIGVASAVLEHVGEFERQVAFLREVSRTCRSFFLTTPNRWFPLEVHSYVPFIHYLPDRAFKRVLGRLGFTDRDYQEMHLLSAPEVEAALARVGCPEARIFRQRVAGLTGNLLVVRRAPERGPGGVGATG